LVTVEVYGAHGGIHYLSENIFGNTTSVSSENVRVVCILEVGAILGAQVKADWAVRALIEKQRKLVSSTNFSMRFRTLWIAAMLDKHLTQCTNREIGELMSFVQDRFRIFEPEFGICHHATRRLLLKP